jgi:hypothetical protein
MKASLKTILLSALGAIAAFTAVTSTSCTPDKCKAIVCAYGGVCKEGTCICPAGYEGYQCETITRDKFKGVWTVFENGTATNSAQYDVTIEFGASMTEMTIKNFYNKFQNDLVNIRIKGDSLYIPQQTINNHEIKGFGHLKDSKYYGEHAEMEMYYSIKLPDGRVNDFGLNGGDVSVWTK